MKPENGERKANYAANDDDDDDDPGLAYLLDETRQQPQVHLKSTSTSTWLDLDSCNINLVNLVSCSRSAVSSPSNNNIPPLLFNNPNSAAAGFEPLQLHLNLTPQQQQQPPLYGVGYGYGYAYGGRQPNNFVTERHRRQTFNDKFQHLRSLLPNPNKNDRASIVGDAIDYIKELVRTVKELNLLVDKKRCLRQQRLKPTTTTAAEEDDNGTCCITEIKSEQVDQSTSLSLRSSWLQRKCKDTDIDVRIVDEDVTIKLVQRKKIINLLLFVSRTLDQLRLQLHHVTGGHVGDYYTFLFNTKISEGSSVYAGAIANKLIEVVDRQYAACASMN